MSAVNILLKDKFNILLILITILLCYATVSCENDNDIPDVSHIKVDVKINRLERVVGNMKTREEAVKFLDAHPSFSRIYLQRGELPDSILINDLYRLAQSPYIDTLTQETEAIFGDMADLQKEFEQAFKFVKYYFPEYNPPPIYTVVTGFANDIAVSDSAIVIGLDYFLGAKSRYRPRDVPDYMHRRYKKEFIVPTVMTFLSNKYNEVDILNKTMLAEMIYHGKAYEFTRMMVPHVNDTLIIGYTGQEYKDCLDNQDVIWANFVTNELFFETSHLTKNKFMGERPYTGEIGDKCPGRIGRWLGWQIIKKYRKEKPDVKLKDLMSNKNAQQIFDQSKYKPKNS